MAPSVFRNVRLVIALGANVPAAWLRGRPCHQIQGPDASECRGRELVYWRAGCLQFRLGWVPGGMHLAQMLAVLGRWRHPLGGARSHIVNAHSHIVNISLATDAAARTVVQHRGHVSRRHVS